MRSSLIRVDPTSNMTGVLTRRRKFGHSDRHTHMKTEAEIRVMHLQVKE